MTLIELEQQALRLTLADRLHLIQVLVQSLTHLLAPQPVTPTKLSEFFRQSPLCDAIVSGELDLSRDRSLPVDRFTL
jgi:hypothetical protein